jgi:hypothetical protein
LLIVAGAAAIVCGVAHLAIRSGLISLNERLSHGPKGRGDVYLGLGIAYLGLGTLAACIVLIVALKLIRVGRTSGVCAIGYPIAVVSLFLTANALTVASGPIASGPAFSLFVVADSAVVAVAFAVASVLTDPRIASPVRIWVALAFATLASLGWTLPYLR